MKMIYAGIVGSLSAAPERWLYNCTRNSICQKPYYIPLRDLSDLMVYFDLPGKPTLFAINIIPCDGTGPIAMLPCNYLFAQTPVNAWYAIFTQFTQDSISLSKFYINAVFTIGGIDYQYYSNQFEIELCDPLVKVESCYNDPANGASAYDCNGVYYGYHAGTDTPVGNTLLRYNHHAYVRYGEVIENSNKMEFTFFNSQIAYKNYFTREYIFQFELIPTFYKDVLIGVFNRGNISIDGIAYSLSGTQQIGLTNDSLKWWKMDMKLSSLCRQWFSCTPTTCVPSPVPCINDFTTATWVTGEEILPHIHLSGGILSAGDSIQWQIVLGGDNVVDSGVSTSVDIYPNIVLDTDNNCYEFWWSKNCACGGNSEDMGGLLTLFKWGYSDLPFGDGTGGTVDKETFPYQYSGIYTPGQPLATQFIGMPVNKYIAVQYPDTESDKTTWVNTESNYGTIPDFVMNPIVSQNGKKYITSVLAMTLDNSFQTIFS